MGKIAEFRKPENKNMTMKEYFDLHPEKADPSFEEIAAMLSEEIAKIGSPALNKACADWEKLVEREPEAAVKAFMAENGAPMASTRFEEKQVSRFFDKKQHITDMLDAELAREYSGKK